MVLLSAFCVVLWNTEQDGGSARYSKLSRTASPHDAGATAPEVGLWTVFRSMIGMRPPTRRGQPQTVVWSQVETSQIHTSPSETAEVRTLVVQPAPSPTVWVMRSTMRSLVIAEPTCWGW